MEKYYRYKGAKPPKTDKRDYEFKPAVSRIIRTEVDLPKEYKLPMGEILDQGRVNSCVGHGAVASEMHFNIVHYQDDTKLSPGYIYGCRYSYKGEGMYLRDALKTLKNNGCATYKEFPYNKEVPEIIDLFKNHGEWKTPKNNTISTYFSIGKENRKEKIKRAIIDYGPCMVSIKWYDDLKPYNGILRSSLSGDYGYHCVVVCGWNETGWIIQNSWGKSWGDDGYATYPYEYDFAEVWGITDNPTERDLDIEKVETNWFTDLLYKLLNLIINLFNKEK